MPWGCSFAAAIMALFTGVIFMFGWHRGNEDLTGAGIFWTIIAVVWIKYLLGR